MSHFLLDIFSKEFTIQVNDQPFEPYESLDEPRYWSNIYLPVGEINDRYHGVVVTGSMTYKMENLTDFIAVSCIGLIDQLSNIYSEDEILEMNTRVIEFIDWYSDQNIDSVMDRCGISILNNSWVLRIITRPLNILGRKWITAELALQNIDTTQQPKFEINHNSKPIDWYLPVFFGSAEINNILSEYKLWKLNLMHSIHRQVM